MRKLIYIVLFSIFATHNLCSCREESEDLFSYQNMMLQKDTTYAGQFKIFWTYMDYNYSMWDYEQSQGLDWDEVYRKFLPKFEEYDKKEEKLTSELKNLYLEIVNPLHDGHMVLVISNPNPRYIRMPFSVMPQYNRIQESRLDSDPPSPTPEKLLIYGNQIKEIHPTGNTIRDNYFCVFSDNIIYYKPREETRDIICNSTENEEGKTWKEMFATIQDLSINDSLKGIVIDLRCFGGGTIYNFHYLIGALHPINQTNNYHRIGWFRQKTGIGRYDYTPKMPFLYKMDETYQLNITDVPIVVLANCYTRSLGEVICLAAKQIKNGCVVGMRSWGGLSPLGAEGTINDITIKSPTYLGDKSGDYSLYASVAEGTYFTDDGEILDGKGVAPDIEVQLDTEEYESTGRDTQLERALEFIRTGK